MSVQLPPTNLTSVFNVNDFQSAIDANSALTPETGLAYFVSYPSAQGSCSFPDGLSCTNLTSTNLIYGSSIEATNVDAGDSEILNISLNTTTTNIGTTNTGSINVGNSNKPVNINAEATIANNLILSSSGSYIQFPDGSQQLTAYNTASTVFSLTSTNNSTNSWTFQLNSSQNNLYYGTFFQYFLYTGDTGTAGEINIGSNSTVYNGNGFNFTSTESMAITSQSQVGVFNFWTNPTTISSSVNDNYFYAYGIGVAQAGNFTGSAVSNYNSQTYNYTAIFSTYYLDIINSQNNSITITPIVKGFGITNSSTAIPSVNTYPTNYITVSVSNPLISSQSINLKIIKIF